MPLLRRKLSHVGCRNARSARVGYDHGRQLNTDICQIPLLASFLFLFVVKKNTVNRGASQSQIPTNPSWSNPWSIVCNNRLDANVTLFERAPRKLSSSIGKVFSWAYSSPLGYRPPLPSIAYDSILTTWMATSTTSPLPPTETLVRHINAPMSPSTHTHTHTKTELTNPSRSWTQSPKFARACSICRKKVHKIQSNCIVRNSTHLPLNMSYNKQYNSKRNRVSHGSWTTFRLLTRLRS